MKNLLTIWKHKGQILEGIRNNIFKQEDVEEVAAYRNEVCGRCSFVDHTGHACAMPGSQPCCAECGCALVLKTRAMTASCPRGYWEAILTDAEESELYRQINNSDSSTSTSS
jgi:hypothetical protein